MNSATYLRTEQNKGSPWRNRRGVQRAMVGVQAVGLAVEVPILFSLPDHVERDLRTCRRSKVLQALQVGCRKSGTWTSRPIADVHGFYYP
jgi:hypothetical protein